MSKSVTQNQTTASLSDSEGAVVVAKVEFNFKKTIQRIETIFTYTPGYSMDARRCIYEKNTTPPFKFIKYDNANIYPKKCISCFLEISISIVL